MENANYYLKILPFEMLLYIRGGNPGLLTPYNFRGQDYGQAVP